MLYAHNVPERFEVIYASAIAQGTVRILTGESERMAAMRAICEKYSADHVDTPAYERTMKGMPAVVMFALDIQQLRARPTRATC